MPGSLGDFDASTVIYGKFTTYRPSTGAAYTLAGTPALSVYKDNSTTQSTTGVTLTADFDSLTGLNHFAIDTSADGTFYAVGSFFDIVITTGTVDGVSVVGSVVASFTLRKDSSLKPTTAGRTLDVSVGGEAGVDWANVGSPTTTLNLSGTTVKTATDVETDTADIQSRLPAALVSGRIDASVGAMASGVLTATAIAADAITAAKIADGAIDAATFAAGAINATAIASDAITDAKVASDVTIASVTGAVGSVTGNVGGNVTGSIGSLATQAKADVNAEADAALADVGVTTTVTGRIDAAVTTRASQTSVDTIDDFLDTEVAAIKAKTDNLPSDPADASDISGAFSTVNTTLGTIAGYLDTEIAAIKAKTDNLPAAPAATGDIPTATQNADALLNRNMASVTVTNSRSPINALRAIRNGFSIEGTTLSVLAEDDTTVAYTRDLTTDANADPITGVS